MLRDVRESVAVLAEEVTRKTATIGKRVQCIRFVDECAFREISVVSGKKKYSGIDCKVSNNFNNERTTVHLALNTH